MITKGKTVRYVGEWMNLYLDFNLGESLSNKVARSAGTVVEIVNGGTHATVAYLVNRFAKDSIVVLLPVATLEVV